MLSDERVVQSLTDAVGSVLVMGNCIRGEVESAIRAALAEAAQSPDFARKCMQHSEVLSRNAAYLRSGKDHMDTDAAIEIERVANFLHKIASAIAGAKGFSPVFLCENPTTSDTQAELDALRKDAERYRQLRNVSNFHEVITTFYDGTPERVDGASLDTVVDAAIAKERKS